MYKPFIGKCSNQKSLANKTIVCGLQMSETTNWPPEKVLFHSALIQSLASDYAEINLLKHLSMKKNSQDKSLTWKIKFLTSDENLNLRIKFSTWENLDFRKRPEIKGAFDLDLKIWIFGFPIIEREIWKKRILSRIS